MFEIFRTYDDEEYTVYVREDGKRFYVDFEEQVKLMLDCVNISFCGWFMMYCDVCTEMEVLS